MAPASKKRGAPASTQRERQKKLTRKEKRGLNVARHREVQSAAYDALREQRFASVADWPRKSSDAMRIPPPARRSGGAEMPYTDELDALLFELLSIGTSLDTISSLEGMPELWQLLRWLGDESHRLSRTYARARELVIPLYEDRALALSLTPQSGVVRTRRQTVTKDGDIVDLNEERESDAVERSKLALSAYQWALGWMAPKKHGPKPIQLEDNDALKDLLGAFRQRSKQIEESQE